MQIARHYHGFEPLISVRIVPNIGSCLHTGVRRWGVLCCSMAEQLRAKKSVGGDLRVSAFLLENGILTSNRALSVHNAGGFISQKKTHDCLSLGKTRMIVHLHSIVKVNVLGLEGGQSSQDLTPMFKQIILLDQDRERRRRKPLSTKLHLSRHQRRSPVSQLRVTRELVNLESEGKIMPFDTIDDLLHIYTTNIRTSQRSAREL
jgi:hypothetical protein